MTPWHLGQGLRGIVGGWGKVEVEVGESLLLLLVLWELLFVWLMQMALAQNCWSDGEVEEGDVELGAFGSCDAAADGGGTSSSGKGLVRLFFWMVQGLSTRWQREGAIRLCLAGDAF